jgi:hypothetical protein
MRLLEITQRELDALSRRSTKWADKYMNQKPKRTKNRAWYETEFEHPSSDLANVLGPHLKKKGLKRLGEGAYAVVYGRPGSDRVVKVSQIQDRCWLMYANWAMGQQHNPHVPDIHHLETYTLTTPGSPDWTGGEKINVFFAVMERLLPFDEKHIDFDNETNIELLAYLAHHEGFRNYTQLQRGVGHKKNPFKRPYNYWDPDPKYINKVRKFAKRGATHGVIKLFKQVVKKWKTCSGDFHDGNIMIRPSTGEFVITDPLAG